MQISILNFSATRTLQPIISINYTDFHSFLGKYALQISVGKSRLTAPFLPQPLTSQNQSLTIKLIETPVQVVGGPDVDFFKKRGHPYRLYSNVFIGHEQRNGGCLIN